MSGGQLPDRAGKKIVSMPDAITTQDGNVPGNSIRVGNAVEVGVLESLRHCTAHVRIVAELDNFLDIDVRVVGAREIELQSNRGRKIEIRV
jgi:hypothetical protein